MPFTPTMTKHTLLLSAAACLLVACETPPPSPTAAEPAPAPTAPIAPRVEPAPPPAPTGPATPAAQAQAQKTALGAVNLLESGREDQARVELQNALALDPANKLALNLTRQLNVDPVATLGRESFAYTVRPSDTLSQIAGRFMGDIYAFYILARYNDIKVPRQVAGGQVIRIPGKAPPPGRVVDPPTPAPAPTPIAPPTPPAPPPAPEPTAGMLALRSAETAERAGDLERAATEYKRAASLDQPAAAAKAEDLRKRLVSRYTVNARTAFAKQDLTGSIRSWDKVLELDPNNDTAKLERQKALMLQKKVEGLK